MNSDLTITETNPMFRDNVIQTYSLPFSFVPSGEMINIFGNIAALSNGHLTSFVRYKGTLQIYSRQWEAYMQILSYSPQKIDAQITGTEFNFLSIEENIKTQTYNNSPYYHDGYRWWCGDEHEKNRYACPALTSKEWMQKLDRDKPFSGVFNAPNLKNKSSLPLLTNEDHYSLAFPLPNLYYILNFLTQKATYTLLDNTLNLKKMYILTQPNFKSVNDIKDKEVYVKIQSNYKATFFLEPCRYNERFDIDYFWKKFNRDIRKNKINVIREYKPNASIYEEYFLFGNEEKKMLQGGNDIKNAVLENVRIEQFKQLYNEYVNTGTIAPCALDDVYKWYWFFGFFTDFIDKDYENLNVYRNNLSINFSALVKIFKDFSNIRFSAVNTAKSLKSYLKRPDSGSVIVNNNYDPYYIAFDDEHFNTGYSYYRYKGDVRFTFFPAGPIDDSLNRYNLGIQPQSLRLQDYLPNITANELITTIKNVFNVSFFVDKKNKTCEFRRIQKDDIKPNLIIKNEHWNLQLSKVKKYEIKTKNKTQADTIRDEADEAVKQVNINYVDLQEENIYNSSQYSGWLPSIDEISGTESFALVRCERPTADRCNIIKISNDTKTWLKNRINDREVKFSVSGPTDEINLIDVNTPIILNDKLANIKEITITYKGAFANAELIVII